MKKYTVLVIDDSVFVRKIVVDILNSSSELEVIGTAVNGQEGLRKTKELRPDVVTLDIEMPVMDGISTLKKIMAECPTSVVILSSLTIEGAAETVKAFRYGAAEIITKPLSLSSHAQELIEKVISAAKADVNKLIPPNNNNVNAKIKKPQYAHERSDNSPVVIIASSTGGPKALRTILPYLSNENNGSYIVVQHLPEGFSAPMAKDLNNLTPLNVKETEAGYFLTPGDMLIAKSGHHTVIENDGSISLNQAPPLQGMRPSADITMISASEAFGKSLIGVVLTGMGRDGTNGIISIKKAGGITFAEDESTCVVYGMPHSAYETGCIDKLIPLTQMADAINNAIASYKC